MPFAKRSQRKQPAIVWWAVCVFLIGTGCQQHKVEAENPAPADLTVEGSAFVLNLHDGRTLRGQELQGAVIHLALKDRGLVAVKLNKIEPDPAQPDILRHDMLAQTEDGEWRTICTPNASGETWGFPVALPESHPAYDGPVTLTCTSGAIAKCARFGYRPWSRGPQGEELIEIHAACTHMVRADYCGDDQPATKNGTQIDVFDDLGIQVSDTRENPESPFLFEAGWSSDGAVCVHHTRWSDLLSMDQLTARCPRLANTPLCDEDKARTLGAKLFNHSKRLPASD